MSLSKKKAAKMRFRKEIDKEIRELKQQQKKQTNKTIQTLISS